MKKPEIDAYGWVNGKYYDDLSEVINPLIDALVEADTWLKTLPKEQFGTYGDDQGTKLWVRDDILQQIKTALRDAGVNEEEP